MEWNLGEEDGRRHGDTAGALPESTVPCGGANPKILDAHHAGVGDDGEAPSTPRQPAALGAMAVARRAVARWSGRPTASPKDDLRPLA